MNPFFQEQQDDPILDAGTTAFAGMDVSLKPSLLPDARLQRAVNVRMDADALCVQRPGLRFLATLPARIAGLFYYDTKDKEALIAVGADGKFFEIKSDERDAGAAGIAGMGVASDAPAVSMCQLVETLFFADGAPGVGWLKWDAEAKAWRSGRVTKDKFGTALPAFTRAGVHQYRVFANEAGADAIWFSDTLAGTDAKNWDGVRAMIRVGDGDGDPIKAFLSFQERQLLVLKEGGIHIVDTAELLPSDWSIRRVTSLAGCVAGRTAVQLGQDVLFLSRSGVMSLGALAQSNSVSAASSVSGAIRRALEKIHWPSIENAWACAWRQYYLLAVPLESHVLEVNGVIETVLPRSVFVLNTETREWCGEWRVSDAFGCEAAAAKIKERADYAAAVMRAGGLAREDFFKGFSAACVVRFGGRAESVAGDSHGRVCMWDERLFGDEFARTDADGVAVNNVPVETDVITKAWDLGLLENWKQFFRLEIEGWRQFVPAMDVFVIRDTEAAQVVETDVRMKRANQFPLTFSFPFSSSDIQRRSWHLRSKRLGRFREAAVQFKTKGRGWFSLRRLGLCVFADSGDVVQRGKAEGGRKN